MKPRLCYTSNSKPKQSAQQQRRLRIPEVVIALTACGNAPNWWTASCLKAVFAECFAAFIAAEVAFITEIGVCVSLTGGWGLVGCMAAAGIDLKNAVEDLAEWGNQCIDKCKNNKPCCKVG